MPVMRILTVIGARPQFIKCAPLSRELRKHHEEILVHTGQHYDHNMSEVFFQELDISKPDYDLNIGSGHHGEQTGRMLIAIEEVLLNEKPDIVLVYGDTNSTLAGALAASKIHMPIAHVEAGLRSYDRRMPEEINRVVTDHLSNLLFAPTQNAAKNLEQEGITEGTHIVGDIMVDSLIFNHKIAKKNSDVIERMGLDEKEYILATVHRPSNTDNEETLAKIIDAFGRSGKNILFPVHPRTKKALISYGLWGNMPKNIITAEPLSYLDMLRAMSSAEKIVTDSGGVQKEAYLLGIPCITLRDTTEWTETVEDGFNVLVGTDTKELLRKFEDFQIPNSERPRYGKGDTSVKIVKIIEEFLEATGPN